MPDVGRARSQTTNSMKIRIDSLLRGAEEAEGTVIIVDVFRAFTTAAVAFCRGAAAIILVAEVEEALDLQRRGLVDRCMGEVDGKRPDGFDFGNSPFELSQAEVTGLTLVQSTRAGTVGVSAARRADQIYLGSLVTAQATVGAITRERPAQVTIVAMGTRAKVRADEDELCALYLRNLFEGRKVDCDALRQLILAGREAQHYGDPERPHFHPRDREMALEIDSIPLALRVWKERGLLIARAEAI
jgi:2-phosphosulfolactate phosphatase